MDRKEKSMKEQINKISITGTLVENKLTEKVAKSGANAGKTFITGDIVIKAMLDNEENLIPIRLYAFEQNKDGAPNQFFASYKGLADKLNRRIRVDGSFGENRFWSEKTGEIAAQQVLNGRFINDASVSAPDQAIFELSGFIARELVEKTNKEDKIYLHELILGQANYNDDSAYQFKLHVRPADVQIAHAVRSQYVIGSTVHVYGDIRFTTQKITREVSDVAFGAPRANSFVVTNRGFFITSGENPIEGETAYSMDDILRYKKAITASDLEISHRAKAAAKPAADGKTSPTKKATSLL